MLLWHVKMGKAMYIHVMIRIYSYVFLMSFFVLWFALLVVLFVIVVVSCFVFGFAELLWLLLLALLWLVVLFLIMPVDCYYVASFLGLQNLHLDSCDLENSWISMHSSAELIMGNGLAIYWICILWLSLASFLNVSLSECIGYRLMECSKRALKTKRRIFRSKRFIKFATNHRRISMIQMSFGQLGCQVLKWNIWIVLQ